MLTLGLDCSIVAEIDASGWGAFTHGWARDRDEIIRQPLDVNSLLPWLLKKVMAGETISSSAVRAPSKFGRFEASKSCTASALFLMADRGWFQHCRTISTRLA